MRYASICTLLLILSLTTSAWAQFGGGGGFGGSRRGPEGFEVETISGITAYREASEEEAGGVEVTWTGAGAEQSQKLAEKIHDAETKIQFINTPLPEVAAYLEQLHKISVVIDKADLERTSIDPEVAITCNHDKIALPAALDLMTRQHNLGWNIDNGVVLITSLGTAEMQRDARIYKLNRLDAAGVAQVISKIVYPSDWHDRGGSANIAVISDRNLLVIRHNRQGHEAITSLLTQLEEMK